MSVRAIPARNPGSIGPQQSVAGDPGNNWSLGRHLARGSTLHWISKSVRSRGAKWRLRLARPKQRAALIIRFQGCHRTVGHMVALTTNPMPSQGYALGERKGAHNFIDFEAWHSSVLIAIDMNRLLHLWLRFWASMRFNENVQTGGDLRQDCQHNNRD